MKKNSGILLIVIMIPLFCRSLFAQGSTIPIVPSDTFPLGIFEISTLDGISLDPYSDGTHSTVIKDKMNECGLNTYYGVNKGWTYNGTWCCGSFQDAIAKQLSHNNGMYLGGDASDQLGNKYIGNRFSDNQGVINIPGSEVRHFLFPTNQLLVGSDPLFDYETDLFKREQSGNNNIGNNDPKMVLDEINKSIENNPSGKEWVFNQVTAPADVLTLRDRKGRYAWTTTVDQVGKYTGHTTNNHAYVDFIYRLNGSERNKQTSTQISNTTGALFTITNGPSGAVLKSIHWSDYATGGRDRIYANGEKTNLMHYADKDYGIARIEVDISNLQNPTFELTLRTTGEYSIYVLGFRIRSEDADKILTGAFNSRIYQDYRDIIGNFTQTQTSGIKGILGANNYNKFKAIGVGGELTIEGYRVYAYMDKIFANKSGNKHLIPFLSDNGGKESYHLYRAIYEDQNGTPPPVIMQESFEMTQKDNDFVPGDAPGNPPFTPSDGIPSSLLHRPIEDKFMDLGFTLKIGKDGAQAPYDYSGYFDYTNGMQTLHTEVNPHRLGFYDRIAREYLSAAQSAMPAIGIQTKWSALLSVDLNFRATATDAAHGYFPLQNITSVGIANVKAAIKNNLASGMTVYQAFTNNIKWSDVFKPSPELESTYWTGTSAESQLQATSRGPFKTEMRADAWCAVSYGAKGLFFNPIGSDLGENIGLSDVYFNTDYDGYLSTGDRKGILNTPFGNCTTPFYSSSDFTHFLIEKKDINNSADASDYQSQWISKSAASTLTDPPSDAALSTFLQNNTINVIQNSNGSPGSISTNTSVKVPGNWRAKTAVDNCTNNSRWVDFYDIAQPPLFLQVAHLQPAGTASLQINDKTAGWPFKQVSLLSPYMPIFYGYKERWDGAKRVVSDISSIAQRLADLNWDRLTINYATKSSTDWAKFPILENLDGIDKSSQKMWRYSYPFIPRIPNVAKPSGEPNTDANIDGSNEFDAVANSFYEMGLFHDPNEEDARFFTICNRRTWPFRLNASGTSILQTDQSNNITDNLLGAVDVRRFNFKVNRSIVDPNTANEFYSVTNLRTGVEEIKKFTDHYAHNITLEPGEGTLLRIAPVTSFPAGKTSDLGLAFNNGHRTADFKNNQRIIVWERKGNIQYNITNNPSQSTENNYVEENTAMSFGGYDFAKNPSVAVKHQVNCTSGCVDTVAVIFSGGNNANTQQAIIFQWGTRAVSAGTTNVGITWQSPKTLNNPSTDPTYDVLNPDRLPTPSIVPCIDGFFCAWANPLTKDIKSDVITLDGNSSGTNKIKLHPLPAQHADGNSLCSLFPSVASRNDVADFPSDAERLYLVWEEQFPLQADLKPNSQIYYQRFDYDATSSTFLAQYTPPERVSKDAPYCEHHHPNVAVVDGWKFQAVQGTFSMGPEPGEPIVTWEMIESRCNPKLEIGNATNNVIVSVRTRNGGSPGWWSAFTTFYPKKDNLPLPQIRVKTNGATSYDPSDGQAVIFQDTFTRQVHIERITTENSPSDNKTWQHHRLKEKGEYPNQSLQYDKIDGGNARTFVFRGVDQVHSENDDNGLYAVRINARIHNVETPITAALSQTISVSSSLNVCNKGLTYTVGGGGGCLDCPYAPPYDTTYKWRYTKPDITNIGASYSAPPPSNYWARTEDSIRTTFFPIHLGDSISFESQLQIDDSAWFKNSFPNTTDTLIAMLVVKDSSSHQVIDTLDGIIIKGGTTPTISFVNPWLVVPELSIAVWGECPPIWILKHDRTITKKFEDPSKLAPSGKGYLTIIMHKDTGSILYLTQLQEYDKVYYDNYTPAGTDSSFKKGAPQSERNIGVNPLHIIIRPNPVVQRTEISIDAVKNVTTNITIFNALGQPVKTLFDSFGDKDKYVFSLESAEFSTGQYFVRVQCGNFVLTSKMEVIK